MTDTHLPEQLPPGLAAGCGEDFRSGLTCDRDRRLTDTSGGRVNQDAVAGLNPGQLMQSVPRGAVTSGDRGSLFRAHAVGQLRGQSRIAGDVGAPASGGTEAGDFVTHPVFGDSGSDRGDHAGEVQTELRLLPVKGGVAAESGQHVGEVDTGCADGDLDLTGIRRSPFDGGQFHGL